VPSPSAAGAENLEDLIQMSADLTTKMDLSGRPLPEPTAMEGGRDAVCRPRHASSSSDISSDGKRACRHWGKCGGSKKKNLVPDDTTGKSGSGDIY